MSYYGSLHTPSSTIVPPSASYSSASAFSSVCSCSLRYLFHTPLLTSSLFRSIYLDPPSCRYSQFSAWSPSHLHIGILLSPKTPSTGSTLPTLLVSPSATGTSGEAPTPWAGIKLTNCQSGSV
ncbi:unnamed protein product [Protopolystoma xenopodis]|uniref:Uncharacterized protein n=1 Tax=Protopolystoma xenopodis TaxID=117903 RepID=A0A3S5B591_9PLAT|nr:unnamed protein product [Protopolystoma xenopodis]